MIESSSLETVELTRLHLLPSQSHLHIPYIYIYISADLADTFIQIISLIASLTSPHILVFAFCIFLRLSCG